MAEFTPKKQVETNFNNGNQYRNGDAIQAEALNNLIEGVLYAQENGSESGGGTTVIVNGEGENSIVQKMEEGAEPNVAKGKNDVALGSFVEVDGRRTDPEGIGYGAFSQGVRNKNYGDRSAQFGSYNYNESFGGFQAGYNQIAKQSQYITQFGTNNFTDKNITTQFGNGHEAGRATQAQFGNYAKGASDNILEVGIGRKLYKANLANINKILGKYYIDEETGKYVEITEENKEEIWAKLLADDKYKIYERKNAFEVKEDGSANLEKQGTEPKSIVLKETLEESINNVKESIGGKNSPNGTEGLLFTITSEEEKTCEVSNGSADSEEIIIPPYVFINGEQYAVASIKNSGFSQKTNIKTVVIPETITKIGLQAFNSCKSLINIKIPSSVVEIGSFAFSQCDSLEEIEIPDSVTSITPSDNLPRKLFSSCDVLTKVILGKGITVLPYQCFYNCKSLTEVIIKGKITSFLTDLFSNVTNVTVWVQSELVAHYTEKLKAYKNVIVKPYRDLIGLNEYANDNRLYQHYVTLRGFAKNDNGEFIQQENLELYPKLRSAEAITLENFYEILSNEVVIGEYLGIYLVKVEIHQNDVAICYKGDGTLEYSTVDVTAQTEDFYWEIDDSVPEIETQGA